MVSGVETFGLSVVSCVEIVVDPFGEVGNYGTDLARPGEGAGCDEGI